MVTFRKIINIVKHCSFPKNIIQQIIQHLISKLDVNDIKYYIDTHYNIWLSYTFTYNLWFFDIVIKYKFIRNFNDLHYILNKFDYGSYFGSNELQRILQYCANNEYNNHNYIYIENNMDVSTYSQKHSIKISGLLGKYRSLVDNYMHYMFLLIFNTNNFKLNDMLIEIKDKYTFEHVTIRISKLIEISIYDKLNSLIVLIELYINDLSNTNDIKNIIINLFQTIINNSKIIDDTYIKQTFENITRKYNIHSESLEDLFNIYMNIDESYTRKYYGMIETDDIWNIIPNNINMENLLFTRHDNNKYDIRIYILLNDICIIDYVLPTYVTPIYIEHNKQYYVTLHGINSLINMNNNTKITVNIETSDNISNVSLFVKYTASYNVKYKYIKLEESMDSLRINRMVIE